MAKEGVKKHGVKLIEDSRNTGSQSQKGDREQEEPTEVNTTETQQAAMRPNAQGKKGTEKCSARIYPLWASITKARNTVTIAAVQSYIYQFRKSAPGWASKATRGGKRVLQQNNVECGILRHIVYSIAQMGAAAVVIHWRRGQTVTPNHR